MSIGVDILKISRLEKLASKTEFLNKLFSQKEIECVRKDYESIIRILKKYPI